MSRTLSRFLQHAFCGVFHHSKLHYPVRGSYLDEVELLLEGGDEVNAKSATGRECLRCTWRLTTAIIAPLRRHHRAAVEGWCKVGSRSHLRHTPLTYYDDQAAVRALLDAGAELDIKDADVGGQITEEHNC